MVAKLSSLTSFGSWPANSACSNAVIGSYSLEQTVTVGEELSFEISASETETFSYSISDGSMFSLDPSADFEFWADVEEWFEVIDPIEDSDGHGFPNFGGLAVADSVTGRGIRFFERLRPGGEMGVILGGIVPKALTMAITSAISDEVGDIEYGLDRRGQIFVENDAGLLTITGSVAGIDVTADYSESVAGSSFETEGGFALDLTKGVGESGSSYGSVWAIPDLTFRWRGDIFVGGELLSEPFTVVIEKGAETLEEIEVSGSQIEVWRQRAWSGFAILDDVVQPALGYDDRSKIRHWIDSDSLVANGDGAADWRLQFRGKEWLAFSASHDEWRVLDAGLSTAGWTGSGVDLSAGILIEVGPAGGTVTRDFFPEIISETYRFLEIEVRSSVGSAVPISVQIGGKSWELVTGEAGTWSQVRIDLCHPDSISLEWDDKESRFPLDEFGEVDDSVHWGVSLVHSIIFGDLVADESYEIRLIRLSRLGSAHLSFLPAFLGWKLKQESDADFVKPLIWSEVDGRIADCYGMKLLGETYSWPNLTELSLAVASLGWNITPGVAVGDGYHGNLLEGELAWGGGVRSGSTGVFPGCDLLASPDFDVLAQGLWDEVEVYPTAGDVWGVDGEFGELTELFSSKILRSQAWGLVLGESGVRSGESVEFLADSEVRGADTSDVRGFYLTGLPGGLESPVHQVRIGGTESSEFEPVTRMRHRRVLREQSSAGAVSFDWHPSGMAVRASIGGGDLVRLALKGNALSAGYSVRTLPFSAESLSVRWDLDRLLRLILVTTEEGVIYERVSEDLGETWSMATILAEGSVQFPGLFVHPDGRRFVYWIDGGEVNGLIRDKSGAVLQEVFGAREIVEEKGLAVGGFDQIGGRVTIELVTVEGDTVVSSLSTDGVTFS